MTFDKTPITILEKEIRFFNDFIGILDRREGIDPEASEEKLNEIKDQCRKKIVEFEQAISQLKPELKLYTEKRTWKQIFESTLSFEKAKELMRDNHMMNVSIRKDGQWHDLDADWIKYLIQQEYPK